jgi:hypothetical protein
LVLSLASFAASACKSTSNPEPRPEGSAAPAGVWRRFENPEGRFSILLPTGEVKERSEVRMPEGIVPTVSYSSLTGDENQGRAYSIAYKTYPEAIWKAHSPDEIVGGARDSIVERMRGRLDLVSDKKVTVDGHPGLELVLAGTGSYAGTARMRLTMIDAYYYLLQADSFGTLRDVPDPDADRFFDSFRYHSAPAPPLPSP